ncbi:MAG: Stp1/IreP family PP2C-type Ser/Thr phosphatase [Blastocatellia bacterium]|nr:Stp1/IreP family PP2C-type Ser/Thr phosphatase [Blastocatellia bacterium]
MRHQVTVAHRSDTGIEREENQDTIVYTRDDRNDCHLLVVADGLGGGACGKDASQLAAQSIRQSFFASAESTLTINQRIEAAIAEANRMILHRAERDRKCRGMGSTCVVLALTQGRAHIAHAGDSRLYLIRDNRIQRLTRDHSMAQRMLDDGLITEDEAATHPDRNCLDRALGLRAEIKPDIKADPIKLSDRDTFILCTDGLTSLVRDEELFRIVQHVPSDQACDTLVELANERGGHDNITVAIARIGADITLTF